MGGGPLFGTIIPDAESKDAYVNETKAGEKKETGAGEKEEEGPLKVEAAPNTSTLNASQAARSGWGADKEKDKEKNESSVVGDEEDTEDDTEDWKDLGEAASSVLSNL